MSHLTTKVTYALPSALVDEVRSMVREGVAPSYSSFVESALREKVKVEKRARLEEAFREAGRDPLFLADNQEIEEDFRAADAESARMIP